jgi:hypothetical protein
LSEYQGHPFVSLRMFEPDAHGQLWATRKGCSIRIREIGDVIDALMQVEDLVAEERRHPPTGQGTPPGEYPPGHSQDARQRGDGASTAERTHNAPGRSCGQPGPSGDGDRPTYQPRRSRPQPRAFDGTAMPPPREGERFDEFG